MQKNLTDLSYLLLVLWKIKKKVLSGHIYLNNKWYLCKFPFAFLKQCSIFKSNDTEKYFRY